MPEALGSSTSPVGAACSVSETGLFALGLCEVKCIGIVELGWPVPSSSIDLPLSHLLSFQFQKFLTLSRPLLEYESPTLEQPKALRPLSSSSVSVVGKVSS